MFAEIQSFGDKMDSSPNLRNMVIPVMVNPVIENHTCLFGMANLHSGSHA